MATKRKRDELPLPSQSKITRYFPVTKTSRCTLKAFTLRRPNGIIGRDNHLSFLREHINCHVKAKDPGSLFIFGPPGTGKTLCVTEVVEEVERGGNVEVIKLNCMTTLDPRKAICGGKGKADMLVEKYVCSTKEPILLVLEEVDHLKKHIRDELFELPRLEKSKLILIGISNSVLDIAQQPRLHFKPYNKEEILQILIFHFGDCNQIHPDALHLCAMKVAARTGDIRDALNHCRAAIQSRSHQGLLLISKENYPTIAELYDTYREVCELRMLTRESEEAFCDAVCMLEEREIVQVAGRKKAIRDRKVGLKVTREELQFRLRDKTLIDSIILS